MGGTAVRNRPQGDCGEAGVEPSELVRDRNFEGDREMERLKLRTADVTSI